MLDEWMEQKVDEACEVVPAYVNPRKIRLASSHIGWRLYLYGSSLKRAVSGFFVHIRSEQDMDIFLRETAEKSDTTILRIKRFLREKARLLAVLDDAGMRLRFATTLYLFGLAALGTLAVGGREMALCALAAGSIQSICCPRRWSWGMSRSAPEFGSDICFPSACGRWR